MANIVELNNMKGDRKMPLTPSEFCENKEKLYINNSDTDYRKKTGQFFTPIQIARFMAGLASEANNEVLKILDPGAGVGILSCAVCETLAQTNAIKTIEIDAYENEPDLSGALRESFEYTYDWLNQNGIKLLFNIHEDDFVLAADKILRNQGYETYDVAIGNPPYFKIAKDDPRAIASTEFVHGQPNIYSLFMGMSSKLLKEKGLMVFITPRSYTAGPYFKAFRKSFFDVMRPEWVHVFESRRDAFQKDSVLQENIILKARKIGRGRLVTISTSRGMNDLEEPRRHTVSLNKVLLKRDGDIIFRLPIDETDDNILETVDSWRGNLHKYGLEISTGPVVPFRATEFIPSTNEVGSDPLVPLLWMQNVNTMRVQWPCNGNNHGKEKYQYIKDDVQTRTRKLLLEDSTFVLLRRFSAKEQERRLTAATLLKGQLKCKVVGIENHLNYIYRPYGTLTEIEALGLASLLNSALLDRYFRISNGNTQVSATELRAMPLPPLSILSGLGERIKQLPDTPTLEQIDNIVWETVEALRESGET